MIPLSAANSLLTVCLLLTGSNLYFFQGLWSQGRQTSNQAVQSNMWPNSDLSCLQERKGKCQTLNNCTNTLTRAALRAGL